MSRKQRDIDVEIIRSLKSDPAFAGGGRQACLSLVAGALEKAPLGGVRTTTSVGSIDDTGDAPVVDDGKAAGAETDDADL